MNLTVTNEALNHELDRLRAKTDQLRNESDRKSVV